MRTIFHPPLIAALWPTENRVAEAMRVVALAVLGSALLWASAKAQVPFWPVPMTMQTYVVLVLAAAYGPRLGLATLLLYLAEGAVGLPVFAGTPERGLGLAYMTGPTAGYLAGFVVATAVIGTLAERGWDRSLPRMIAAMTLGHGLILAIGWAWLAGLMGAEAAYAAGVAPFWAATVLKTALAGATLPAAWRLVRQD